MEQNSRLKIIPLGGLEQIGLNMTVFEYEDDIVIVDCGLSFPEDDMLGIDLVIPDFSYILDNMEKVRGICITHGHEDHIGALSYAVQQFNVPIYATKLTMGIIEYKFKEAELLESTKRNVVSFGDIVRFGKLSVEFIKTNHSISDAAALAISSPVGTVIHTGDFKVDYTPVFGDIINLQRFAQLGQEGVLALLSDSTNAVRPGFTMSERTVGTTINNIFSEYRNGRIIIGTFASNVDRVQQIIDSAYKFGRKVVLEGRSMINLINIASELGYIKMPENTIIDISFMKDYPDEQICIISTGSQGESMAALSRMAFGLHKKISIKPTDTIIFSSNPIPGNEKAVSKIINELAALGAKVIFQDVHVSGHACQEELKLIYSLTRPKFAIPVHGEFRHLQANAEIAIDMGMPEENVFILKSGDVLSFSKDTAEFEGSVQTGAILVDGLGVGDIGNIVLKDRQKLAECGIFIVCIVIDAVTGELLGGPDVVSRGFVYMRESEELIEEARQVLYDEMQSCYEKYGSDWTHLKNLVRNTMEDFIWKKTKRSPMVLPIIMEV